MNYEAQEMARSLKAVIEPICRLTKTTVSVSGFKQDGIITLQVVPDGEASLFYTFDSSKECAADFGNRVKNDVIDHLLRRATEVFSAKAYDVLRAFESLSDQQVEDLYRRVYDVLHRYDDEKEPFSLPDAAELVSEEIAWHYFRVPGKEIFYDDLHDYGNVARAVWNDALTADELPEAIKAVL